MTQIKSLRFTVVWALHWQWTMYAFEFVFLSLPYFRKFVAVNFNGELPFSDYYPSMALQPFVGPWPLFSLLIYTQSVGLIGRGISPSQGRYLDTEQHKHTINAHRRPCFEWDANPRSQCSSKRRLFMPYTSRPLWPAFLDKGYVKLWRFHGDTTCIEINMDWTTFVRLILPLPGCRYGERKQQGLNNLH
jgi:hypothetical protein